MENTSIKDYISARNQYISLIKAELLGPGSEISIPDQEHELVTTSPDIRYSIGVLFPKNNRFNADNNDTSRVQKNTAVGELEELPEEKDNTKKSSIDTSSPTEENNLDEEIGLAAQNMPSSMGITFLVSKDINQLICSVSFATYAHATSTDCRVPFYPANPTRYSVPLPAEKFVRFDRTENTLKLCHGGIKKSDITQLKERDLIDGDEYGLFSAMYKLCDQLHGGYVRVPHSEKVTVCFNDNDYIDANRELDGTKAKITALKRKINDGLYSITVMLVNDEDEHSDGTGCIFQPTVKIASAENSFFFCEYSQLTDFSRLNIEDQSLELQYRNKKLYGTGLGTSANWDIDTEGNGVIYNDFFPESEVPSMDFSLQSKYGVEKTAFSMKSLSDLCNTPKEQKIASLKSIISAYKCWIDELSHKIDTLNQKYHTVASINVSGCNAAYSRMVHGLELLESDNNVWDAFSLANRAMFMQRVHLSLQSETSDIDRYPGDFDLSDRLEGLNYLSDNGITADKYFWRPFQIAFMLMSIGAITEDTSDDRNLVDLIWFPTGGGKTEAYLLLTAFTIFYRRLANSDIADGTTVIMRYTLRLLAAQQFTRASTLICACEMIREDSTSLMPILGKRYTLGRQKISIGLWIGHEHIPNTNNDAKKHLKELIKATVQNLQYVKEQHNKFQVLKCPWCGTKLVKDRVGNGMCGTFGYRMRNNHHFEMFCPQEKCYFNAIGSLPIQIIDEELYKNPPTLLFGTVDKFAMIPWKETIGNFFAVNSENRPPELIIQDELHLISGPLGTMVGLYESVVDALCEKKGLTPKIVASTATIRRAKEQCAALYNRDVNQFPHPGIDAEDSFFARESVIDYANNVYGRTYIGLMPSGKTKAMMEVRSIAALLQKIHSMNLPDEIKDKYWTLTVYFNSLKDLGKCSTLVDDDVKDFIKRTVFRLGTAKDARIIAGADELTSRVNTTRLNETLDKLEKVVYSKDNLANKRYPSNVLLATNMISVGIDVARLNVMLMVGQPKLTSEYIQASSRVGRSFPGVAFAMYDGSKSRDRSHFEQFKPYHESFYKFVEPTGATPFSKPARDRALHAIVIAMMRMTEPKLTTDKGAASFTCKDFKESINRIKDFVVNRAVDVTRRLNADMDDDAEAISMEIETVFETWEQLAENYDEDHFYYGERFMFSSPEKTEGRLLKMFNTNKHDPAYDTMTSMRNVDSTVSSNILIWEDK